MTTQATPFNASDFMHQKVIDVKSWYDSGSQPIEGLDVRHMPARVEPTNFVMAEKGTKNRARFNLVISKNYKLWSIELEMQFFCQPWLSNEGVATGPGLMFAVVDEEGNSHPVEYFPMSPMPELDDMTPPQWCSYWIQKALKQPSIKIIFAYRQLLASEMDD